MGGEAGDAPRAPSRLARRAALLAPLAALPAAPATAQPARLPLGAPGAAGPLGGDGAALAQQGALTLQSGAWRATTHGELAAAYVNVIPSFRQAAGEQAAARSVAEELRERVAFTQFLTAGRSPGAAIAAAIDYLRRNNGASGGEVLLPPGPPIQVTEPIAAAPGVLVRGPRRIETPRFPGIGLGVFEVDGAEDFTLADLHFALGRRCSPVRVTGDASGFAARGLRIHEGRSIWFEKARHARLADIICRGGTAAIGAGARPEHLVQDVVATGIQAYDLRSEAIDLNFNVIGFQLIGFAFRRCSLAGAGEAIDIGGGTCRDIAIANGVIDCGGEAMAHPTAGIRVKLGTQGVAISGVSIVNGRSQGGIGIHLADAVDVAIAGSSVDGSFARGFFAEPSVRDVTWRGGRCDSPLHVNGSRDVTLDIIHDGGGAPGPRPAYSIGFGARRVTIAGTVRNRPEGAAASIGGGRGGARDCRVLGLVAEQVARGVLAQAGCERLRLRDLAMQEIGGEAVVLARGCRNADLRGLVAVDYSAAGTLAQPAIRVAPGCDGSLLRDIIARDTRQGEARHAGPAVLFEGASRAVLLDGVVADNLPGEAVQGAAALEASSLGAVLTA